MTIAVKICADCGQTQDENEIWWPDAETDGEICQMCWEAQCDREWWEAVDYWNHVFLNGIALLITLLKKRQEQLNESC